MKEKDVEEIIACLHDGKTQFYYFKDRYALLLLSYFIGDGELISEAKKSHYAGLLSKKIVKQVLKDIGDGVLTKDILNSAWPTLSECYLLTLGK